METKILSKTIQVDEHTWQKLKEHSKRLDIRRDPGKQAGFIIRDYFDNNSTMKATWKMLIDELDSIIGEVSALDTEKLKTLCSKRASLELAFNSCEG